MRVHVDGLLPLIKQSVVEFPNGDEVITTLVYERLDKHCLKCCRLDHELKECLVARAEAKALKAAQEEAGGKSLLEDNQTLQKDPSRTMPAEVRSSGSKTKDFRRDTSGREAHSKDRQNSYTGRDDRRYGNNANRFREGTESWRNRGRSGDNSSRYHPYRRREEYENSSRQHVYREVRRLEPSSLRASRGTEVPFNRHGGNDNSRLLRENHREEASSSKEPLNPTERGTPLQKEPLHIDPNALEEALGEVRDTMLKYTRVDDPTESAARLERMRQAEERGQLEKSAAQIARKALAKQNAANFEAQEKSQSPPPRRPVSLRLGPLPDDELMEHLTAQDRPLEESPITTTRVSATLRLGAPAHENAITQEERPAMKRKPGRPPGGKKVSNSPKTLAGTSSRNRKVAAKPPVCRRKLGAESKSKEVPRRSKPSTSRGSSGNSERTHSSDNVPLRSMIPKTAKKRVDFQDPLSPLP